MDNLETLPKGLKAIFLRKLNKCKTEAAFLSLVSELYFGLFFDKLGFSLQYEKVLFDGKTPDWIISIECLEAICEVYRLGQSEKDQKISDFESKMKRGFEELKCGVKLEYSIQENCIDVDQCAVDNILLELKSWLSHNRNVGDYITIDNTVRFEIRKFNKSNRVTYVTSCPIEYKIHKLEQSDYMKYNNVITEKLTKYTEVISKLKIPYFVCIDSDIKNGFSFDDFSNYFLGSYSVYSEGENANEDEIKYSKLGSLYNYSSVSGVIVKIGNDYRKVLNPSKNQVIYEKENFEILKRMNFIKNACVY